MYVRICMFYEISSFFKEGYGQIDFIYTGQGSLQKPMADDFFTTTKLLQGC